MLNTSLSAPSVVCDQQLYYKGENLTNMISSTHQGDSWWMDGKQIENSKEEKDDTGTRFEYIFRVQWSMLHTTISLVSLAMSGWTES